MLDALRADPELHRAPTPEAEVEADGRVAVAWTTYADGTARAWSTTTAHHERNVLHRKSRQEAERGIEDFVSGSREDALARALAAGESLPGDAAWQARARTACANAAVALLLLDTCAEADQPRYLRLASNALAESEHYTRAELLVQSVKLYRPAKPQGRLARLLREHDTTTARASYTVQRAMRLDYQRRLAAVDIHVDPTVTASAQVVSRLRGRLRRAEHQASRLTRLTPTARVSALQAALATRLALLETELETAVSELARVTAEARARADQDARAASLAWGYALYHTTDWSTVFPPRR